MQDPEKPYEHDSLETLLHNDLFRLQVKAYLANDLYESGVYTQIMNASSQIVNRGVEILADERKYVELLQGPQPLDEE